METLEKLINGVLHDVQIILEYSIKPVDFEDFSMLSDFLYRLDLKRAEIDYNLRSIPLKFKSFTNL